MTDITYEEAIRIRDRYRKVGDFSSLVAVVFYFLAYLGGSMIVLWVSIFPLLIALIGWLIYFSFRRFIMNAEEWQKREED